MKNTFFFFLLITLCITQNILGKHRKSCSKKKPELKARLPINFTYYVEDPYLVRFIGYIMLNLKYFVGLLSHRQTTQVSGSGINFLKSNSKSDIILNKDLTKPTNIYILANITGETPWLVYFFTGIALGLVPEITRYDRDKYVTVNKDNINPSYYKYFKKETRYTKHFTNFDYGSIMMPKFQFGSKNKEKTYTLKFNAFYGTMVYRDLSFSSSDLKRLYQMYFKDKCFKQIECKNRGYPSHNCGWCRCVRFFSGKECEKIEVNKSPTCGSKQHFKSSSKKRYLKFKNINGACFYKIKSIKGKKVAITVKKLILPGQPPCSLTSYVYIHYGPDYNVTPIKLCGNTTDLKIPSLYKVVYIEIHSNNDQNELSLKYHNV